jgi:glyoxylase-like metal-dependent hydrolase (beta-lactamase superfamily II)
MLQILKKTVGALSENCYLFINDKECLIIDPGDQADYILEEVSRQNLKVLAILITHGHFDHVLAAGEIISSVNNCPLMMHKDDFFLLERAKETAKHFTGSDPLTLPITTFSHLKEQKYTIGTFTFDVIYVPGHTPGSCAFYFKEIDTLFSGDIIFSNAFGRTDFSYSDKNKLNKSILKIANLPNNTRIFPGHEEETSVSSLRLMLKKAKKF